MVQRWLVAEGLGEMLTGVFCFFGRWPGRAKLADSMMAEGIRSD